MLVNSLKSAGGGGLFGSLGGLFGGGDATSAGSTPSGAYSGAASGLKFAKGGVFDSPNLSHFSNSIISSPTMFKFAKGDGLMGEAGPEAVMPLTRTPNGTLGVRMVGTTASGGGGGEIHITQHINVSGNGDAALNRAMQEAARQGAADGAKKARQDMLSDFQTNGQARRMLGV